ARASAAPPGKISDTVPVISPGGGCRLTRPTVRASLSLIYPLARLKLPVLAASKSLRRSRKAGAARMDAG
ncbi:hypothetical protein, partial [Enterobacter chengduensis]|uniref:hypothetical protein n=1 Tax=Enterobacter chengduensis TaxID=2494701 RepID=UPI002005885D